MDDRAHRVAKRKKQSHKTLLFCLAVRKGGEPALRAKALYVTPQPPLASAPSGGGGRGFWNLIQKKQGPVIRLNLVFGGAEGARTLDLRRDRPAF